MSNFLLGPSKSPSISKSRHFSASKNRNFGSRVIQEVKLKIIKQCEPVIDAYSKSLEIWEALKLANYKKEGTLNRIAVDLFFHSQAQNLSDLLSVKSSDELIELIDDDQDGSLNQDEQISIFFLIKLRMHKCADELCQIHEYDLYENILKDIEKLEKDIISYQKIMRVNLNEKDLNNVLISKEIKQKEFEEQWEKIFQELEHEKKNDEYIIKKKHEKEKEELKMKVLMDSNLKIKPISLIKFLQTQEKLIAIDEKIVEAKKIRNELERLEISEANRIEFKIASLNSNKFKKLELKHKAEINHMLLQYEKKKINLLQRYQLEKIQIEKRIQIKMNEFIKNQELSSLIAEKNVVKKESIAKMKEKSMKKRIIIKNSKSTDQSFLINPNFSLNLNSTVKSSASQISFVKGNRKEFWLDKSKLPSFYINSKSIDKSHSSMIGKNTEILNKTLKKIEEFDKKQGMTSICSLYNEKLELLDCYM